MYINIHRGARPVPLELPHFRGLIHNSGPRHMTKIQFYRNPSYYISFEPQFHADHFFLDYGSKINRTRVKIKNMMIIKGLPCRLSNEILPYRGKLRRGKVTKFFSSDENYPRRKFSPTKFSPIRYIN